MSEVSITTCTSYDAPALDQAIEEVLSPLGNISRFVKPGQKVLLKVNALMGATPESAIPTHPGIVKAVAKQVLKAGATPFIGDSPGGMSDALRIFEKIGYTKIAKELGIEIIPFQQSGIVKVPSPHNKCIKTLHISKVALDADVIINLPKLKTHMMMLYTGAIKNMFGTITGFHKSQAHFLAIDPDDFAAMLVDIYLATKPELTIMDAVEAMEGQGPSAGTPRKTGLILAGSDGVAIDSAASFIIGYEPRDIPTTLIASELNIGEADLKKITVFGPPLEILRLNDFKKGSSAYTMMKKLPKFLLKLIKRFSGIIRIDPFIDREKCTACLTCVKNCPVQCIEVEKDVKYNIDHKRCIMCFCCHELCPYKAITLKRNFWAKLVSFTQ